MWKACARRFAIVAACTACGEGATRVGSVSEAIRQCASPQSVDGIDVSDDQGTIDWAAVRDAGVSFAFIKATQGTYETQKRFGASWQGARDAGILRGAYHFFDPTEDGAAQAASFLAAVGPLAAGDLPLMVDVECPDGDTSCLYADASGEASPDAIASRMAAFVSAVERSAGRPPVLYTFPSYFASNGIDAGGLAALPLFIADVTPSACFEAPSPWAQAVLWQWSWTGSVPGIAGAVDRDRFIGSPDDLAAFAQGSAPDGGSDLVASEPFFAMDGGDDSAPAPEHDGGDDSAPSSERDGGDDLTASPAGCACHVVGPAASRSGGSPHGVEVLVALVALGCARARARRRRRRGTRIDGTRSGAHAR